eukprot:CAMPEP_0204314354 /NCGR_PEP_ID=MMETSP0469-20131031/4167_1 /ASSEMBLY_ACC=CAM_ASM_000384 /TAXON_ID=2969 /ORGANISM="Oxyrrhis marina" /LENGTH=82 /DNA_ID=CAMNT_0051294819 /DNA_START=331 /DNA_END=579 /DNA_ORIENTATION=+
MPTPFTLVWVTLLRSAIVRVLLHILPSPLSHSSNGLEGFGFGVQGSVCVTVLESASHPWSASAPAAHLGTAHASFSPSAKKQ